METKSHSGSDIGVTNNLSPSFSSTLAFIQNNYIQVYQKGQRAAEAMDKLLTGHKVRRSYFYHDENTESSRETRTFQVSKVTVEDAGIIRIYDSTGTIREFPAMVFDFAYRKDAVLCMGNDYIVLLEVI